MALQLKDRDQVLIVEGYSDLRFYAEVLEHLDIQNGPFIQQFNGKQDLIEKLESFITPQLLAEKRRIGLIVDGDDNPAATFNKVRSAIQKLTGQLLASPGEWTAGKPPIGVFVTPDGASAGEIETLVWTSWSSEPSNSAQRLCIETYINCMAASGCSPQSPQKGLISALLAIQNDDDPRLGPGAQANVFNLSRPEYGPLRNFLSEFGN